MRFLRQDMGEGRLRVLPLHRIAALALAVVAGMTDASSAQEVLFLRIRPMADPTVIGSGGSAGAALAAREAGWARSNARARRIIESICDGCLAPWTPPAAQLIAAAAIPEIPGVRGLETDRSPEASDATPDTAITERRP